jgi:hypothetical protein
MEGYFFVCSLVLIAIYQGPNLDMARRELPHSHLIVRFVAPMVFIFVLIFSLFAFRFSLFGFRISDLRITIDFKIQIDFQNLNFLSCVCRQI